VALIIAEDMAYAKKARNKAKIEYEDLPVITDAREAAEKGHFIMPPKVFESGNIESEWAKCEHVFEGTVNSGGQEHLYLETQGAIAIPGEGEKLKIISSTQSPTGVQRIAARVLGMAMHQIEVDVLRLGGGFGGKEDQATHWGVLAALGARKTGRPVKLVLSRLDDIKLTGKRHPYSSDYKIGLSKEGKILAYEVTFYQNAGACADLSPAILERTLFHAANCYCVPNVKATAYSCKTNLVPNTAFRGFGGPQGMFVIEAAIYKAAEKMRISTKEIQEKNLIKDGDKFYYGQKAENSQAVTSWDSLGKKFDLESLENEVAEFNSREKIYKKGIAYMPICFGISFTNTALNQASALVHVYTDGSIGVSTAAVEMGQGVNAKIMEVVARTFSVDQDRVKIESTNTTRIANTSATAASSGADLNGNAALIACSDILKRLKTSAAEELNVDAESITIKNEAVYSGATKTDLDWSGLVVKSYLKRISLSSQAFYATPDIYFDRNINQGSPFAYHVYGTSVTIVKLNCLLGTYEVESVKIVHDYGESLQPKVDLGQLEGGLAQGIGWLTIEEIKHDDEGKLLSNTLSTYKVPDIYTAPKSVESFPLENSKNRFGPFNSKAIGEPPFMYAIGTYFAIVNAMKHFRPDLDLDITAPMTHERVLTSLYQSMTGE
jgi:xanthine dehydrogenase large subunit